MSAGTIRRGTLVLSVAASSPSPHSRRSTCNMRGGMARASDHVATDLYTARQEIQNVPVSLSLQERDFLKSRRDQDAVLLQCTVLGEMAKRVSLVTLILPSATICTNRIKRYCHDSGSQIRHSD
jgi:hypothetical protein